MKKFPLLWKLKGRRETSLVLLILLLLAIVTLKIGRASCRERV